MKNMTPYEPGAIELKWQAYWEEHGTNTYSVEDLKQAETPYYNLMMFPYPSAEGLHIGNIYAYTGADVNGRFHRLQGKDVFEPIGFDAFGIHSENFALKNNTNPNELVPSNIANFERQLKRIGGMFDWSHTVDTTDPEYYRWTQWLFLQLYSAGLVERKEAAVNWCPSCMTVVANEQVIQGACERCDALVEQRRLPQWFLKITRYAEKLLGNIDDLDWSERTKKAQINWIGQSQGAEVDFPIEGSDEHVRVFTTRPDTLCGATYMVLAPEHELVASLTTNGRSSEVEAYLASARKLNVVERKLEDREKTGVWIGANCINPLTGRKMPVWVSDYVLIEYGTGAIMAVPAHDERDFDFATKFELPIVKVIAEPEGSSVAEQAYTGAGVLINSDEFDGLASEDAKSRIVEKLSGRGLANAVVNYRLHDWCISRQRYWGPPIPMVHCDACGAVPVDESDLPVTLPFLDDFQPSDTGESPLSRLAEWYETSCPKCGEAARRETDVSDTFLDSCWYYLRYPCTDFDNQALDDDIVEHWLPVTSYIGGNEHAVLHLLYSRFVCMALQDMGLIQFDEPFARFRAHGLLIKDGAKISKSRGNVIIPDDTIERYGADTLRIYLMFIGPFTQGGDYREDTIQGPATFLQRVWQSVEEATSDTIDSEVEVKLHQTIRQVTDDMLDLRFNTAIAAMMEYINVLRSGQRQVRRAEIEPLVIMIAPFAPHIAEELWQKLGHQHSIFESANWPAFDARKAEVSQVEIGIQINGKTRGSIQVAKDCDETTAVTVALEQPSISSYVENKTIRRAIYVPGRILNLVVN